MNYQGYPIASPLRRLGAALYDGLLLAALLIAAAAIGVAMNAGQAVGSHNLAFQLGLVLVHGSFYVWFWTHGGQTLGMRAWRMRLVDGQGNAVSLSAALLRLPLSWLFILGMLWCLIDSRGRAAQDILSGTQVIVEPRNPKTA